MIAWEMFGGRNERQSEFMNVGSEWYIRAHSREPVPVLVIEDPDGAYWGWIDNNAAEPAMIQPHPTLFRMQFVYGPDAEVEAGKGRIVRLRITERAA